jgi:lipoprotein-releasing system permease protein
MNFPFYIARRYLFSKKSHHAINVISLIAVVGVAVTTMALICVLSVFNGFQDLVASCFTNFDPQLKVMPAQGKTFSATDPAVARIRKDGDVEVACGVLEDKALARYGQRQAMITLMGVEDNFDRCTDIDRILYGNGRFALHADVLQYGIPGIRLAMFFNMGTGFQDPLEIYTPRAGAEVNMMDPTSSFNNDELNSAGVVFSVNQKKYDQNYVICSLQFAQSMFEKRGQLSALELKLRPGADAGTVKKRLQNLAGEKFRIADRYEQQEDVFRIMKTEKYMAFLFLTFILLTACFNIVGSLSMLIIDKKKDVRTLRDLGATDVTIERIFLFEGRLISVFGAVIGLAVGLLLCWLQQRYGLLRLGDSSGTFIVDAYPVSVRIADVIIIFFTVLVVSFVTSWYPVRYLSRKLTN